MSPPLRIAVVRPAPWSPADDVAWRALREAEALARRGHLVTVLTPGSSPHDLAEGRRRLTALTAGDTSALAGEPGTPRVVCVGRAIRAGARRRLAGPIDLAAGLETALRFGGFDVVHLHEPLLPSPALSALRHTRAATVATFHRADPLAGVAFLGPLVQRALARVDVRIAASRAVERALSEVLPGRYERVPAGVDDVPRPEGAAGDRILVVARGRDRTGLRFGLRVLRSLEAGSFGSAAVLGPGDAPRRAQASVPKALRPRVEVLPDAGPGSWREAVRDAAVVLLMSPGDVAGPVADEALAHGRAIVAPRGAAADERLLHAESAVLVPPFQHAAWTATVTELLGDAGRRAALGAAARRAAPPTWDAVAETLESLYGRAIAMPRRHEADARVTADLRLRLGPSADPRRVVRACREAGVDVVAVASPEGVSAARRLAAVAGDELTVIAGREVATADGVVVGLFLVEDVPDGLPAEETLTRIRAQGGVTVVPHPDSCRVPPADTLRRLAGLIDCRELATGAAGPAGVEAARAAQRLGVVVSAGSGAGGPDGVGGVGMEMRAFSGGRDLIDALADATPVLPRRARRARTRERARTRPAP